MTEDGISEDLIELVKMGYGDLFGKSARALHFRTDRLGADAAAMVVALVDSYNEYKGAKVAEAIPRIRDACWDSYQLSFEFGREYSPVLYIHVPFWVDERNEAGEVTYRPLTGEEQADMIGRVMDIGREILADETDLAYANTVRLWWD